MINHCEIRNTDNGLGIVCEERYFWMQKFTLEMAGRLGGGICNGEGGDSERNLRRYGAIWRGGKCGELLMECIILVW